MAIFLGTLLGLFALAVVAWPFFRPPSRSGATEEYAEYERLARLLSDLYEQIRQVQADREAGAVTDEEYHEQLRELRLEAAYARRGLDRLGYNPDAAQMADPAPVDRDELERRIAALRKARAGQGHEVNDH